MYSWYCNKHDQNVTTKSQLGYLLCSLATRVDQYRSSHRDNMVILFTPRLSCKEKPDALTSTPAIEFGSPIKCRWIHCGEWFGNLNELASHVSKTHAVAGCQGLFYCGWEGCSRTHRGFNARYKMLVHVRTHTNEKPHQCLECYKSFSRAENLKIHARSHTGEKPYVCPVPGCQKAYSNSSDRFKHTRTHLIDKPYMCKVAGCDKRYTDPSSLRKHAKTYNHYQQQSIQSPDQNYIQNDDKRMNPELENNRRVQIDYVTTHFSTTWLESLYPSKVLPMTWTRMEEQQVPLDLTTHPPSNYQ